VNFCIVVPALLEAVIVAVYVPAVTLVVPEIVPLPVSLL
jgi:hypothetical protein